VNNRWTGGQYGIFRALLGAYLFVHFAHLFAWGAELFSNAGMLGNAAHSPIFGLIPSVFSISDSPTMVAGVLVIGAVASMFFAVGKHDKLAAFVMWYILASLFGRNPLIANPALPYLGWMLLAHLFMPAVPWGALAAKDRIDPAGDWHMPRAIYFAAWLVLALSYSYSGYTKLLSPSWANGDTVWYVLQNPLARDYFVRDIMLRLPERGWGRASSPQRLGLLAARRCRKVARWEGRPRPDLSASCSAASSAAARLTSWLGARAGRLLGRPLFCSSKTRI